MNKINTLKTYVESGDDLISQNIITLIFSLSRAPRKGNKEALNV